MSDTYFPEITFALNDENASAAVEAYRSMRRAITMADDMSEDALVALRRRVIKAADKYRGTGGRQNSAMVQVLEAYAVYLNETLGESV